MTDVFVRVYAQNHLRLAMVNLALTRWLMEPGVKVRLLVCAASIDKRIFEDSFEVITLAEKNFCVESKRAAEEMAKSEVYVLADDDQLIIGKDWLIRGLNTHYLYEKDRAPFAFLAARSINGEIPDSSLSSLSGDVVSEHPSNSVGTPYFIRKWLIEDFPSSDEQGGGSYDTIFSKHCIDKGYRVGFMRNLRFNHLGCGYSTVVPGHWGA